MLEKIITILYLSGDPISITKIAELLSTTEEIISSQIKEVEDALSRVGLSLLVNGKNLVIVTKPEYAPLLEQFRKDELKGDLTPATLQVLTLVAYLGEVTRENISYIRGVQSSQSIRTLLVRGLITRTGEICSLTTDALQILGVTKKEELPEYARISTEFLKKLSSKEE